MTGRAGQAETAGAVVVLRGVRRVFESGVAALGGIDLAVRPGEFVTIVGPSGCGKSTLLRLVAGLESPQGGEVWVDPAPPPGVGRSPLAFVFQDAHLLPWRSVLDNVALPLELAGWRRDRRRAAATTAVEQVGLAEFSSRYPSQLSGGMRMRASIARALVTRPRLLLLDEPFAAIDELTRERLDEQLYGLWREQGITVLLVTHSVAEAVYLSERVVVLSPRPATVVAELTVDLPAERDAQVRTSERFVAALRTLRGHLDRAGA
ncbi:MAG: ABC transporter ATP-binding protein [Acidobacteriota bacterium]